ncbi:hypothetical protein DVS28_a0887 [Euzebya pacifica]|uniref:Zinc finger CGNR domain-containing protein n=1 Tax=Euzebya pacifica TaxID=1608957 RepID=A0A346XTP1_9ACTN|nr:CGNR zinc finger domain-containing protein [Euzebya pacifica]AXV05588.1 hypothetical protein DVS28_a0887 [Euzebya pacifica]
MSSFRWIGNHPGIDLVNTVEAPSPGALVDLLPDWTSVQRWAVEAQLVERSVVGDDEAEGERAAAAHATVVALRDSLRDVLDDKAPSDHLDAHLAAVPVRLTTAAGPPWVGPLPDADPLDLVLVATALAVVEAAGLPRERVRTCASHDCVLHFHDTTRGGGRRWCDMATCGNRAKQAAHTRRQHGSG